MVDYYSVNNNYGDYMENIYKRSIILALGHIITRALGLLIIFPFNKLVGNEYMKIYNYAYIPFVVFSDIITIGVIPQTSKMISNNKNNYILKILKKYFIFIGILGFIIINLFANFYVKLESGFIDSKSVYSIRFSSISLLIIPLISFYRGVLLGYLKAGIIFLSNILEQILRLFLMLGFAYVTIKLLKLSSIYAIYFAFISNFISSFFTLILLGLNINKIKYPVYKIKIFPGYLYSCFKIGISTIFITFYQLIDSLSFIRLTNEVLKDDIYKIVSFESHRVIIIPIVILQSIASSVMPELKSRINKYKIKNIFNVSLSLSLFFFIFCFVFAKPIYSFFYDNDGFKIFRLYSILIVPYGLYKVFIGLIEGSFKGHILCYVSMFSFFIKIMFNIILIPKYGYRGLIVSSFIASFFCLLVAIFKLRRQIVLSKSILEFLLGIMIITIILLTFNVNTNTKLIITGFIYAFISIGYYLILRFKQHYLF